MPWTFWPQHKLGFLLETIHWSSSDPILSTMRPQLNEVTILPVFFSGYVPVDLAAMENLLDACAEDTIGMEWMDIQGLPMAGSSTTCGEAFLNLWNGFFSSRTPADPSRLDDPLGGTLKAMIGTSVLQGAGYDMWAQAVGNYDTLQFPVNFAPAFSDVSFGWFGDAQSLSRADSNMQSLFPDDLKVDLYQGLGTATWGEVLLSSPAEPTLARGVPLTNQPTETVSLGGWTDQIPAQALKAMGCDRTILVNRPDGVGSFVTGVAGLLGLSPQEESDLYELTDPYSSWTQALVAADGNICADWDAPAQDNIPALMQTGYDGILISDDPCILSLDVGGTNDLRIAGCTPLVPKD